MCKPLAFVRVSWSVAFAVAVASPSRRRSAQSDEAVGVRAQGMGGAFVAVADDATATWWNPAGLAGGAYFNAIIECGSQREPRSDRDAERRPPRPGRCDASGFAVAFPALGLSYYRLRVSEIQPLTSTGAPAASDKIRERRTSACASLVLSQFGATRRAVARRASVVGSTLKLVTAGASCRSCSRRDARRSMQATDLDASGETHAGLDLGAMAIVRPAAARADGAERQRAGVRRAARCGDADAPGAGRRRRSASGRAAVIGIATLAVDADLTTTPTVDRRRAAARGRRRGLDVAATAFGVRGGVSANTVGDAADGAQRRGERRRCEEGLYVDGAADGRYR